VGISPWRAGGDDLTEIVAPVDLCLSDGRLNPAAIGWSRRPLHRCNLQGHWPRKKRWEYWGVISDEGMFSLTIANIDYLGLAVISFLPFDTGELVERVALTPAGRGVALPDTVGGADVVVARWGLRASIEHAGGRVRLRGRARGIEAKLDIDAPNETLNVVIPRDGERFQFTSKQTALPARGEVTVRGRRFSFSPGRSFAALDFGRGMWAREVTWNWACAAGVVGGRTVGINLGGQWTRGTGQTENALCVDGRLHKLADELDFQRGAASWRVRGPRVDLKFTPIRGRDIGADLKWLAARLNWAAGRYQGSVELDGGERLAISGLLGWCEEFRGKW
jgi:hypothetical protein